MGQAIPEQIPAGLHSTSGNISLGGRDPLTGREYIFVNFSGGGYGGNPDGDGLTNGNAASSAAKTQPIEILEQRFPVMFDQYALREDSAGAGKWRGGYGIVYRMRLLRGEGKVSFLMEHGRTGPHGLAGGGDGASTEVRVTRDGRDELLPHVTKASDIHLREGDVVEVRTPGGGGYGDPADRAPSLVRRDLARGYMSPDAAADAYGAALDPIDGRER